MKKADTLYWNNLLTDYEKYIIIPDKLCRQDLKYILYKKYFDNTL